MKEDNPVVKKSYAFAVRIVRLHLHLQRTHREYVLSRQVLRCGTSIGANIEEAIGGQSRADFLSKISIAYKETRETLYWLRLLHDTEFLSDTEFKSIFKDADELVRLIGAIQRTTKNSHATTEATGVEEIPIGTEMLDDTVENATEPPPSNS
jgi:four helix bundle protein